jgi:hypothetical protein
VITSTSRRVLPNLGLIRCGVSALVLTLAHIACRAQAQDPEAAVSAEPPPIAAATEPPGYRDAVDAAVSEHDAGHFAESRALFARANALFPNARALRGIGMAEFELRNYRGSIDYLEQALSSTVRPLEGELRAETEALLARARGFVGRFHLVREPSNATVTLNGSLLAPNDSSLLVLAVGDHQIAVAAEGYGTEQRSISVTGGEDTTLEFKLPRELVGAPVAATAAAPAKPAESKSVLSSPWLWVAVGAVAIGAGVGIGVAASSGGSHVADANGGNTGVVLKGP